MDVIKGNPTLFMRRDEVEAAWTWVEPILRRWAATPEPPEALPGRHQRTDRRRHAPRARRPNLAGARPVSPPSAPPPRPRGRHRAHRRAQRRQAAPRTSRRIDAAAAGRARPAAGSPAPTSPTASPPPSPTEKPALRGRTKPNIAIVSPATTTCSRRTSPTATTRAMLKKAVIRAGGIAQFAGGVPAMCDGITQGRDGMQLSLYSRDVIAMSTAIALSHDMFDGALMLGVCDKIVPGLLIGALSFGHLPTVFVPAGPMASGLPNGEKARDPPAVRRGQGRPRRSCSRPRRRRTTRAGTCTFYGTANSNQLLMEVLGLHLPGSSFVNPGTPLREALTRAAGRAGRPS